MYVHKCRHQPTMLLFLPVMLCCSAHAQNYAHYQCNNNAYELPAKWHKSLLLTVFKKSTVLLEYLLTVDCSIRYSDCFIRILQSNFHITMKMLPIMLALCLLPIMLKIMLA